MRVMNHNWSATKQRLHPQSVSDCMMRRFAADNPSTLSCIIRRAGPTAWKPRSALSEMFLLALWPGSIRIRSAGGIFGFPQLVYSPRYSRGGRRGRRLPSPPRRLPSPQSFTESEVQSVTKDQSKRYLLFGLSNQLWYVHDYGTS